MDNLRRAIKSGEYPKEGIVRSIAGRYAIVRLGNHRGALTMRVRLAAGLQPNVGDTVILSRVGEEVMALSISESAGTVLVEEKAPPPPTASTVAEGAPPDEGGSGIVEGSEAGGDLSGYYPNPTVAAIQGRLIDPVAPNNDDALVWDAAAGKWKPKQIAAVNETDPVYTSERVNIVFDGDTAGGDLGGTYPNPTVVGLQGRPVSNTTPNIGQALRWDGVAWAPASDPAETDPVYMSERANIIFAGNAAGGDLSGTYPNPTVIGLQGRPIASNTPITGQALRWNGSAWMPDNDPAETDPVYNADKPNIWFKTDNITIYAGDEADALIRKLASSDAILVDGFDSNTLDSAWQWAGAPFTIPVQSSDNTSDTFGLQYKSVIHMPIATLGLRAFLYRNWPPPGTNDFVQGTFAFATMLAGSSIGVRYDDGTDSNYVEAGIEVYSAYEYRAVLRYRIGSGTVTTVYGAAIYNLPIPIIVKLTVSGTKWTSWYGNAWVTMPYNIPLMAQYRAAGSATAFSWTPQRWGIYFRGHTTGSGSAFLACDDIAAI